MFMNRVFHVLLTLICSLNMVFDEHFRISDVHGMDEKVYGGQTMSKRKLLTVILLAFVTTLMLTCAVFFTACGNNETPDDGQNTEQSGENPGGDNEPDTDPDDDKDIVVTSVSLDKTSLTLEVGENYTLVVTVSPSNATDKTITWSSTNSSVAVVSGEKVTAKSEGTTTITAEAHNGKKATCTVTVNEPAQEVIEVTSVSLNKTSLTLEIGASETLTATVLPSNATDKSVTWTSSAQSVATVANGKITAVGSGTATITATTSNGKTATCMVTVNAAVPEITQVEGATIDGTDIFMLVDHTTDSVALLNKVTVSSGSWDLYSDILGQNRIPTKIAAGSNGRLQNGNNVFYIMLENENGDLAEVYTLTVYRSYAVAVNYYNHRNILVHSDTAYTGYEYALNYDYTTPGYTFNDWTENGTAYQARVLWDKLSLYADMTANSYTVSLDANGDEVAEKTQTVTYDDSYAFPVPVRTGYTFLGWYSGDVLLADAEDETSSLWKYTDITSATAKWQINQYTLTTEGLSTAGTFTEGGTYDYGTKLTLTASTANLGYDFLGWYEEDTCLTTENVYTFALPDKDIVLTAKYEVKAEMTPFYFNSTQTECVITGVRDTSIKEIIVPDYVVKIENAAFRDCSDLTSVAIPESVTSIGSNVFYGCRALTSVTIPDGLTNIESSMFNGCSSLTSITIPENVTSIGSYAFYGCSSLTSVTIPDGVMSIGSFAFSNCSGLTEIKFNAVSVADASSSGVFGENTGIENGLTVIFGNSVQRIPDYLFYHCDNLTSVTIGDSITSIGKSAFSFCSGLTEIKFNAISMKDFTSSNSVFGNINSENSLTVVFGKSVQRIPDYLFYRCDELTSLVIENNVTRIGSYAFCGCDGLTSVIIPDNVTSIGDSVFDACNKLTSVTIGKNVKNLGKSVFRDCSELTEIKFNAVSMEDLTSAHNILEKGGSKDGLTVIFGDGVQRIPGYLFYTPDFVNDRLQGVKIPASVTCIGASAFKGQLVRRLYIDDLTAWCNMSFEDDKSRPMGNHPSGYSWGGVLYLNDQRITDLVIPDGITHIRDYLFEGITNLKHVTISNTVTNIGNGAFYGCSGLTSISIPDSVMSIGTLAFADCSGLSSISIPDSVTSIGSSSFRDCIKLKSITIPDSVTCIDTDVFSGCDGLTSISIPFVGEKADGTGKVHFGYIFGASRSINNADYVPASLKEVIITGGSSIGSAAFYDCSGLTSITISASVTSIGSTAFYDCSGLTRVIFENPNGWWRSSNSTATSGTGISSSALADPSIAATYLTSTYCNYYWKRG